MTAVLALDARVATTIVVVAGLAIFGGLLIATAASELRGRRKAKVPPAYRPAPADEELERRVIERYLMWGAIATIFMALWLPAYWLREPTRQEEKRVAFQRSQVEHGRTLFKNFCVTCHGPEGSGGVRQFAIGGVMHDYAEPPLKYVYSRYQQAGRKDDEITLLIYDAINRGRSGTPMPTWGLAFGGPLNSAQVDDIVAYLQSVQAGFPEPATKNGAELFTANCAICHGDRGEGGVGPNLTVAFQRLSPEQVFETIKKGRLNVNRPSMPAWAGLGDDAIRALVEFLRSIQKG